MIDLTTIDWTRIPTRYTKPTTRWGRSAPRRFHHEPMGSTRCTCGDQFSTPEDHLRHTRVWGSVWKRVRFRYEGPGGEQVALPLAGHQMTYRPTRRAHWGQVRCSCGWASQSRRLRRPGPVAREHVRASLRQRVGICPSAN